MEMRLRQRLWFDTLTDPGMMAEAVIAAVEADDYDNAMARLRLILAHDLPAGESVTRALEQWPWSIDLHALATRIDPTAIDGLAAAVRGQNRRWATLAWACWDQGDVEGVHAAFDGLDPDNPDQADDRRARSELRLLTGQDTDDLDTIGGADGLRLSLLRDWLREGGAALSRRAQVEPAGWPAAPGLWSWVFDALMGERDLPCAVGLVALMAERFGDNHDVVKRARLSLAFEREDAVETRALVESMVEGEPWTWPASTHAMALRSALLEARGRVPPTLVGRARAAARLYPRDWALHGLSLTIAERFGDWDRLVERIEAQPAPRFAGIDAEHLLRIGLPEKALAHLDKGPDRQPIHARFGQTLLRARILNRLGRPREALAALPDPINWQQRADLAYWASDMALALRDMDKARAVLAPALEACPTRMGLLLNASRRAFFEGETAQASSLLVRFRDLKAAVLGRRPALDLRDLVMEDAQREPEGPVAAALRHFSRVAPAAPVGGGGIVPRIATYWEGRSSKALERCRAAWQTLHPDMDLCAFDRTTARAWLEANEPDLVAAFDAQAHPATRADLFRCALVAHEGGLFVDADEYPRAAIGDWLVDADAVFVIEEGFASLANNFLAARPGHPVLMTMLDAVKERLRDADTAIYPWWDTGPAQLALAAHRCASDLPRCRLLSQAEYDSRVSTNLPFPHKWSADHWRSSL
ncbi:MAG: hypothetical protein R3D60_09445 [Paracoccaceae bacterium]